VADAVRKAALELRKQLPVKVDEKTTLLAVVAAGRTLKYSYRMSYRKAELPAKWVVRQKRMLTGNACAHPGMRKMMELGVTYSYLYTDTVGRFLADINISNRNC